MRQRQYRLVIAIGSLMLLTLATAALGRPLNQDRRHQANAEPALLGPFDASTPRAQQHRNAPPQRSRRPVQAQPRNAAQAQPQQRLRLHEILQQQMERQSQASPAASAPNDRRVKRPARVRQSRRSTVARAHYALASVPQASPKASASSPGRIGASALVVEARRYLGTNPTKMARLWCARFINLVLGRVGYAGTGSDAAKSFAHYGRRISRPQYGAIAVLTRKGGGHVGIVTGVDRRGNPILIAGNNGRRKVGISVYNKRRVIAYVMPDGSTSSKRRIRQARR